MNIQSSTLNIQSRTLNIQSCTLNIQSCTMNMQSRSNEYPLRLAGIIDTLTMIRCIFAFSRNSEVKVHLAPLVTSNHHNSRRHPFCLVDNDNGLLTIVVADRASAEHDSAITKNRSSPSNKRKQSLENGRPPK